METGVRKALGKGIDALFPAAQDRRGADAASSELAVPIHEIVPNPEQPRRHFDDEALGLLADSIRRHGLLQPLVARRIAGRYELIAGERRLRAALRAGLERVPVIVREARAGELRARGRAAPAEQERHGRPGGRAPEPSGETPGRGPSRRRPPPAWARRGAHAGSRHARADRASPAGRRDRDRVLLRRRARPPDRPPPAGRAARLTALTLAGSRC